MTRESPSGFKLSGRVAVVTGGGGLLGIEHGHALAEMGATVVLADLDFAAATRSAELVNSAGYTGTVVPVRLDVCCEENVRESCAKIETELGEISILVNNAAINPKVGSAGLVEDSRLENLSLSSWQHQMDVGLTGALICTKVFGTRMAEFGHGVILNISSDLSVFSPDQRLYKKPGLPDELQPVKPVSYSVIKTGLIGLTRYVATYWADRGVRVNALSPGGIYTSQDPSFVAQLETRIPLGRMARPTEYRGCVQFLCSDASSYMTGQNLVVDGGRSVW